MTHTKLSSIMLINYKKN